jgi:hypothetical protein
MTMAKFRSELEAALGSIEILAPHAFRFGVEPAVTVTPGALEALVAGIQGMLYLRCYSHRLGHEVAAPPPDPDLVARLMRANAAQDRWDSGWQVYQVTPAGQIFVLKGDRQRSAQPGEYVMEQAPGLPPQPGAIVTLRVVRGSLTAQPGFYHMSGEALADIWDENFLVRFYFHCTPQHVDTLVATLTRALIQNRIPYRMKALSDATHYTRTDSAVLYCARRYMPVVGWIIGTLPEEVLAPLRHPVPLGTKRFAPGIGVAEDPGGGESFGMNRCRMMAEAIIETWQQGRKEPEARLSALEAIFTRNALSIDRPYLRSSVKADLLDVDSWREIAA